MEVSGVANGTAESNAIVNKLDGTGFVFGHDQLGGGHDNELVPLKTGKSVTIDDITCEVASDDQFSCSRGTETFTYSAGDFTTSASNHVPSPTQREEGLEAPGTSCGTYEPQSHLPAENVMILDDSSPMSCKEAFDVLAEYETYPPDGTYGQRHIVPFDGWTCSIGGADYSTPGERVGPGCINDSRNVKFSMSPPS